MSAGVCHACTRQLRRKRLDLPHEQLTELIATNYGAGYWRWQEHTYVCNDCGLNILHTTSKTHRGPCWIKGTDLVRLTGPLGG